MGLLLCVVLATIFITSPVIHCRSLSPTAETTLLNVAAALKRTKEVVSVTSSESKKTPEFTQEEQELSSSSAFSLPLHSRMSVQKTKHSDYKSLVMSRLRRDSVRVRSLTTRLDLAVTGTEKSEMKPLNTGAEFKAEDLETPLISGASQGSGEYFSRLAIGKPATEVYMVIDTGSDVNWVQCAPCADCYQQEDPIFEPASSASYSPLTCDAKECKSLDISECRNGSCLYEVSYGDGSYTVGDFVTETITLGSTKVDNVAIGCGHNNEGLFIGAAGLLGLGGGSLSFPSQLNASTFSYCLVDRDSDSASTLEFNSNLAPNAVTAPLLRNNQLDTFLYIALTGISVGGNMLQIPKSTFQIADSGDGGIIVDSGTAVTRLQTDAYNMLRDAFAQGTKDLPSSEGVALFDTCYDLSSRNSVEVPTVSFHFPEGKELPLPAKNYLIPVDGNGTFCFAFAPTASALSIIGNVQQQGTRVGFDLRNSVIGFVPSKC